MKVGHEESFIKVRNDLLQYCKGLIAMKVGEEFKDCTTDNTERQLLFAAKNLVFAIDAYMSTGKADEADILTFINNFITCQLDAVDTWCDIVSYYGHV
jgi:hypothetical protein